MVIRGRRARCGKCGRGILVEGQEKCKVCHAVIDWYYDAVPGEERARPIDRSIFDPSWQP
jgi:hypothetical protein